MAELLEKVTALIVRPAAAGHELLLFQHETAGIQIPAGTVEPGETPRDAVLREAREETGLHAVAIQQELGFVDTQFPDDERLIGRATAVYARPTVESFDWARLRRGILVRRERQSEGFTLITYQEWDQVENPTYVSYQITGWVPDETLTATGRRHFFLLSCAEATPERWTVVDETHRFSLFWAPLAALPAIVWRQAGWVAMLPGALRGEL